MWPHFSRCVLFLRIHSLSSRLHGNKKRENPCKTHVSPPKVVASMELQETYIMIKPDGVQRGLVRLISRFEKKGFKLKGLKLFECPKIWLRSIIRISVPSHSSPSSLTTSHLVPLFVWLPWEGIGVVASARKLIGATNPLEAEPGTIRGDLAVQTGRNVVHGSDSPENGKREIALWFREGELTEWTPVQAPWVTEAN